jgi:hypothetical protein
VGSSDVLPNPTEITIGASVNVVDTEGPVSSCAKVISILSFSDAATFCLEGNFSKGEPPSVKLRPLTGTSRLSNNRSTPTGSRVDIDTHTWLHRSIGKVI